jgi:hypothetical protein
MSNAVNEIGEPLMAHTRAAYEARDRALARGCRGAACPAFAICQGRCGKGEVATRVAPDGGVWIDAK